MSDQNTAPSANAPAEYRDDENLLFRTALNGVWKAFDPWRVGRILARELKGEPLHKVMADVRGQPLTDAGGTVSYLVGDPQAAFLAGEKLYAAVREAFQLPPIQADGSGVGEAAVHRVLNEYVRWKIAVKKNAASSRTSGR